MITIFQIITLVTTVIGLANGMVFGAKLYGWLGGLIGGLFGAYLGLILGRLPGFFSKRALVNKIRRKNTDQLLTILHGNQFHLFHLVIAELAVRGEDIQKERSCVVKLLVSDNYAARVCGWRTVQYFFPDVAKQIEKYQPKDSVEVCRTKTQGLAEMA